MAWLRDPPHLWRPGTLDRDALHHAAAALARRDGFIAAAAEFARCWQQAYDGNATLRAVMRNSARYLFLATCMYMHHRRRVDDPGDGITVSRMIEFYGTRGTQRFGTDASPSRIKAIIAHCKMRGLLQPAHVTADARVRPLQPTPKLEQALAVWVGGFLRGIAPVLPLPAPVEVMVQRPRFLGELFSYRLAAMVEDGFALPERLPLMQWVMSREKGYHVFLSLVRELRMAPDGTALVHLLPVALAERAGVSRGTVLNLLAGFEREGLVGRAADCRALRLQPAFIDLATMWIALEFLWMHTLACAAWERVGTE